MSQRPGTPFDDPMGSIFPQRGGPRDTLGKASEQGKAIGKGIRMAGEGMDPRLLMMSMNMPAPNPNTDAFMGGMQQTHSY